MDPVDAFWHLANLLGPALGLGVLVPALAKLVWRKELRAVTWRSLAGWITVSGTAVVLAGLVLLGRDGKMLTYVALVAVSAAVLWWRGRQA
jgi:hypothetical protein